LGPGEYPEAVQFVDALVQATRALPGVHADRIGLVGHSRGRSYATVPAYCEGCGHNTFFTNSTQRDDELQRMTAFLRRNLGR
jgi:hypothetical protein